ncbi:MAG: serine hydrolase [Blastocatellia bacterium AA13]|nr:MAG: serine hydrolase [Blastocatellia bacterium AA13]
MKKTRLITNRIVCLILVSFACASLAVAQDLTPKFEEYMNGLMKQGKFSGSVLIARDGAVLFSKGYGMANLELDVLNTPETKFRLGSITKQFTATAILLLQERGKLSVQDPLCKYITDCPAAWSEVTIHHLLSHTGGIPNFTNFADYQKTMMIPTTVESLIARFKDKPLDFKPGEKWDYSNSGYVLLGYIIEKASGMSYEEFLRKNIFDPLKMMNSGYDHHATILKNRATGYEPRGNKVLNASYIDMTIPHGAGALYSTVGDLLLWDQALYGEKLLSKKSLDAMFTPVKDNYGYGWFINKQFNRSHIGHDGGINGFNTSISRYPEQKLTVVVLTNLAGSNPQRVAHDFAAIAFGETYEIPHERTAIKVDSKILDTYTGKYELTPQTILTITNDDGRLMLQASGQGKIELFAESEIKFFLKVVDAQITFVKDDKGAVNQLVFHQGRDLIAKRTP